VESAMPAGWAALAGLRSDDVVEAADGVAVGSLEELKRARAGVVEKGGEWWVLQVRRRGQTLFVEINLKAAKVSS